MELWIIVLIGVYLLIGIELTIYFEITDKGEYNLWITIVVDLLYILFYPILTMWILIEEYIKERKKS